VQEAFELADVIDARFELPRPIVAAILAMIRTANRSFGVAAAHEDHRFDLKT